MFVAKHQDDNNNWPASTTISWRYIQSEYYYYMMVIILTKGGRTDLGESIGHTRKCRLEGGAAGSRSRDGTTDVERNLWGANIISPCHISWKNENSATTTACLEEQQKMMVTNQNIMGKKDDIHIILLFTGGQKKIVVLVPLTFYFMFLLLLQLHLRILLTSVPSSGLAGCGIYIAMGEALPSTVYHGVFEYHPSSVEHLFTVPALVKPHLGSRLLPRPVWQLWSELSSRNIPTLQIS